MLAVIGLGGAGGNVADEASKYGFTTGAINFSKQDLDSLENVKAKFRLQGSDGAGHDREEAKRLLLDQIEPVVNFIREHCDHQTVEVIAFPFATGGGTGSGIASTIIEVCSELMPEKAIVALPIMPDNTEVDVSQDNTTSTFEELSRLNVAVFPVDNQKVKDSVANIGKGNMYQTANESVMGLFARLFEYTSKFSKNGNFDKRDLLTILRTKGIGIISEVEFDKMVKGKVEVTRQGVANRVHSSWNDTIFTTVEYSHVLRAGLILDADEEWMNMIDHNLIFGKFKSGKPIDLFEGNYHEHSGKIMTILTGLAWCNGRLEGIEEIIKQNESKIEEVFSGIENQSYTSSTSSVLNKMRKPVSEKRSVVDVLSKYKR